MKTGIEFVELMRSNGFQKIDTGGNCTAYQRITDNGDEILITQVDDPCVPCSDDEPIRYGLYDKEGNNIESELFNNIYEYFYLYDKGDQHNG